MKLDFASLYWPAIGVAAFATFMIGGLWYTALFGKTWVRLHGFTPEQLARMQKDRPPPVFFGTLIACYCAMAIVVALITGALGLSTAADGAILGAVLWALVTAIAATGHVAGGKPWAAMAIDSAYQLIYLPMTGAIVAGWH